jgi:N-acetylglucosamine transport system permease protein
MKRGEGRFIVTFLAPAVIIYAVFVIWPLLQSFMYALYKWHGVSAHKRFLGLKNFTDLMGDPAFHKALQNNLVLLVVGGFFTMVIAVTVAHGVQGKGFLSRSLRGLVLVPQMLSLVVVAILWMFIFNPQFGLVTTGMNALGLGNYVKTWLGDPQTAFGSVGVAFVWYAAGFYIMLFAAGIRSIPQEVVEASELDGASGMRRFWRVTWPMLWSIKRVAVVHLTITVMNVFVLVYLMTQGGPDRATEVLLTYLYQSAFTNYEFGYATALAVVNFAVVMVLSAVILFAFRRNPELSKT